MDVSNTWRIVILGKTGAGKSNLANTIFGEELFTIGHTIRSETRECKAETKSVNGRSITLIHRYTEHEQAVIDKIQQYFSEEVFKYATVLFTHGDQLPEGQTIEDFVCKNKIVSDLVKKCGSRCHVVDNKYWKNDQQDEYRSNKFQVAELLKTIEKIVRENKGGYFTNEMLQAVEEEIQREEELIRQSAGNMSEKEIREQAKGSVFKNVLIRVAGIATGALLGAFFGVAGMVALVVKVLKT